MAWYNFLSSSDKVVDNLLDKDKGLLTQVGGWIGGMNYSEEEKAEANTATALATAEFVKATLSESTIRSKTRRSIAMMWLFVELFLVLLTCGTAFFNIELAKFFWSVAMSDLMFWTTMAIISFFFGSYMITNATNKIKPKTKN